MPRLPLAYIFATLSASAFLLGCGKPTVDPAILAQHRERLALADEPDGAQTVLEVRQAMYGIDPAEAAAHEDHDHDGDGVQDHAPEDHPHDDHDHADHDHADHEHPEDAGDDAEEESTDAPSVSRHRPDAESTAVATPADGEDHAEHDHEEHTEHDHADHEHEHEGEAHAHEDHDHDGDGVQDHTPEEHDAAMAAVDPFKDKEPVVSEMDVVMVGSVGGVPNPTDQSHPDFPFADGKAVFFLADPEAVAEMEEHEHKHAPGEECSFCAAHAAESAHLIAVVQFADENGKPLNIDSRDLFDLKEKETVVVRGKAKIAPGGMLTVDATGLYVRR